MRVGVVRYSTLKKFGRWDARFYLDPTRDVDKAIARTEQAIARARARLKTLREQRNQILQQHREVRKEMRVRGK